MSLFSVALILFSVLLSVSAQLLLKQGMSNPAIQVAFNSNVASGVVAVLTNVFVLGGLFAYGSSAAVWLGVLVKVDVSKAYPFVGLGFIGTMLCANWFLNEPITFAKILGTLLIVCGVMVIAR